MAARIRRLDQLPAFDQEGQLLVVVESVRGSGVKLKYDVALDAMTLSRPLPVGVVFPFEFGFVPSTRAEDGDPLDAVVMLDDATFPGVVLRCRPLGIVRATQKGSRGRVRNDRLVTVAEKDRRRAHLHEAMELPAREREEIERFFHAAVAVEGKELQILGWGDANAARAAVDASRLPRPRQRTKRASSRSG